MGNFYRARGVTIIEVIMSITLLRVIICPLMSMFVISQRMNNESSIEYKSIQKAQQYMEEIKVMDSIDTAIFYYNSQYGFYERKIQCCDDELITEITIKPDTLNILYNIEIVSKRDGIVINKLIGSKIFN